MYIRIYVYIYKERGRESKEYVGTHRKTIAKHQENHKNTQGNRRKTVGKPWENHRKTYETCRTTIGKPKEHHRKTIDVHVKQHQLKHVNNP